ncbi:MAG: restriction endonuclease subunit M, partial [Oenococcus sp.]
MNKRAIEKFSIQARRDLIDGIDLQLRLLGIDDQHATAARPESTTQAEFYADMALPLVGEEITWRRQLVQEIQKRAAKSDWQTARKDLIEEVAYTWFNRIIAIRFMEVNDYLTTGIRVLSSEDGSNEPEIMTHTRELSWQFSETEQHIIDVADRTLLPEDMDRKYRMLFLKQVSELRQSLPNLFEHTDDFMKLLFTPSYNKGV